VRFQYESRDQAGQWWRSYGNELWEFDSNGLMSHREASINDVPIQEKTGVPSTPAPNPGAKSSRCGSAKPLTPAIGTDVPYARS
jgi:Protein of unknown function (DUF1348)